MTVNELIEALKDIGDEKFRDAAKVRIVANGVSPFKSEVPVDLDSFDVKTNVASVDLHVDFLRVL